MMSYQARRELLAQVAPRYREADRDQKTHILDEFVACTGYARKYAIHMLTQPLSPPPASVRRPRPAHYGPEVQEALLIAWRAANYICGKRLVPFLPELVAALERHGHLPLTDDVRHQLLSLSPATADRIFRRLRQGEKPQGATTTKPGTLLKRQVPVRTFADWEENRPGFMEADLVAHCGASTHGTFLNTLVLTDIATGWTEFLALLYRSQETVLHALTLARHLLPFALLGLDTDNGTEFLNFLLLAYCEAERITFTRGRAYRKNDQCHVEQKNGAVVRQVVGYDRYEGRRAYEQLVELYRAVRLYVNFFQPSVKLSSKERTGSKVKKQYDEAQTPYQRLVVSGVLSAEKRQRLEAFYQALDPVTLREQMETLQDAFWRLAEGATTEPPKDRCEYHKSDGTLYSESGNKSLAHSEDEQGTDRVLDGAAVVAQALDAQRERRYRQGAKRPVAHTWRTRVDPFEAVWEEVQGRLEAEPERTAKSLLEELQQRYPGKYPSGQLRTLQRRVKAWRREALLKFDQRWLEEELAGAGALPGPLRATSNGSAETAAEPHVDQEAGELPAAAG